jgi:hypothetical protein
MNSPQELRRILVAQASFTAWVAQTPDLPVVCQTPPAENCQVCGTTLDLIGGPRALSLGYTSVEMACPNRQRSSFSVALFGHQEHDHDDYMWAPGGQAWLPGIHHTWR